VFLHQKVVGALLGALIFLVIVVLVRRRRLTEARAALWLISGFLIFILSLSRTLQVLLGRAVGSTNTAATLLALGVLFLFTICLDLAVQVTRLNKRVHDLLQEFALLEERVRHDEEEL